MQHFANFGFEQVLGQTKNLGQKGLSYAQGNPIKTLAGTGALAGAIKGTGIGELEEERANTGALGRLGKIAGNAGMGAVYGTGLGYAGKRGQEVGAEAFKKYTRKPSGVTQMELPI
jgi:hypothetical protein